MSSRVKLTAIELLMKETAEACVENALGHVLNPDAQLFIPRGAVEPRPPSYEETCAQLCSERLAKQTARRERPKRHNCPSKRQRLRLAAARRQMEPLPGTVYPYQMAPLQVPVYPYQMTPLQVPVYPYQMAPLPGSVYPYQMAPLPGPVYPYQMTPLQVAFYRN